MIQAGQSASVVPVMAREDGLVGDRSSVKDRPRSALASRMSAVTARLDGLWTAFHNSPQTVTAGNSPELTDMDIGGVVSRQPLSAGVLRSYPELDMTVSCDKQVVGGAPREVRQAPPELSTQTQSRVSNRPVARLLEKEMWHLDSDSEINSDGLNSSVVGGQSLGWRTDPRNPAENEMPQNGRRLSTAGQHAASVIDNGTKTRVVTIARPLQPRTVHMDDNPNIELVLAPAHDPTVRTDSRYGRKLGKTDR